MNYLRLRALSIPVEEYRERRRRVQREMAALDLDALLCHTAANACYVTGFEAVLWFKYVLAADSRLDSEHEPRYVFGTLSGLNIYALF